MATTLSAPLRALLTTMNLGRLRDHPLAGWQVLTILYRDGSTSGEPMTLGYLTRQYNAEYLDPGESVVTDELLHNVLDLLVTKAHLVEANTRKVRERMTSGRFHVVQSYVYRINAAGIEFLKAMQRVADAENTVVASTKRIQEFCDLVAEFQHYQAIPTDSIALYDDFNRLLSAYEDVINGMRKLDVDLQEICSDLAFDRVGQAAAHLQQMLHEQAIPAYSRMLTQAPLIQWFAGRPDFAQLVAFSRQAKGNLDVAVAVGDEAALASQRTKTVAFVRRRLGLMVQSFDPSTAAIQASFDSIYLLYQTLGNASALLAREYEHIRRQTVDVRALTAEIDELLTHSDQLVMRGALPQHLPMDRLTAAETADVELLPREERGEAMADLTTAVRLDMLEAGTMPPVTRTPTEGNRGAVTAADNPAVATDEDLAAEEVTAQAEFARLVMKGTDVARVTQHLEFTSGLARDAVAALFPATQYADPRDFSVFGRAVLAARITSEAPVFLHLAGEDYVVRLPHGFEVTFASTGGR